uniref:Uncharacterized protein n=1 Tax=Anguilla anguilla TaxID=7936 RepID=A0A0E9QUJ9_ANGAN
MSFTSNTSRHFSEVARNSCSTTNVHGSHFVPGHTLYASLAGGWR